MQRRHLFKLLISAIGMLSLNKTNAASQEKDITPNTDIDEIVKNKGYVDPEDFGAVRANKNIDSTRAFQDAIDYAIKNGFGEVKFSGVYYIGKPLHKIKLPADDGSISSLFVKEGDIIFSAEETVTMNACLLITGDISLVATNIEHDMIIGPWNINESPINTEQLVGIAISSGEDYSRTSRYHFSNFTMSNYFIGRICLCISEATYESLKFIGCGISGLKLGMERCHEGVMTYSGCMSGDIIGGWWTNRNSTYQDSNFLPPYPAHDVNLVGWVDFCYTEEIQYAQIDGMFSTRLVKLDAFFDKYFFKSANSKKSFNGGRLSNSESTHGAIMPTYYGIAGRARLYISRYGRPISGVVINRLKTLGCHRTPVSIFAPKILGCYINDAYIERSGLYDNRKTILKKNAFGIDCADLYRESGYGIGYTVAEGLDVKSIILSSGNQITETHDKSSFTVTKGISINSLNLTGASAYPYMNITSFDGENIHEKYGMYDDFFLSTPIKFAKNSLKFDYLNGVFKPDVNVHAESIDAFYIKCGNVVNISITLHHVHKNSVKDSIEISNLPYPLPEDCCFILSTLIIPGMCKNVNISVCRTAEGVSLIKDSAGTFFSNVDLIEAITDFSISLAYVIVPSE
ncbi:hypothetical protein [Klebsiella michiganensis]|uniref:hypothetical protein n=1 Tax=Klebsiella michiganensis TaxID=1134687 RepID=UPI001CCDEC08|nr:hypothetical protein [Klebsiella michiganensis]MBZ7133112.1 hypothetical protein [Klebsiella michiganensis]